MSNSWGMVGDAVDIWYLTTILRAVWSKDTINFLYSTSLREVWAEALVGSSTWYSRNLRGNLLNAWVLQRLPLQQQYSIETPARRLTFLQQHYLLLHTQQIHDNNGRIFIFQTSSLPPILDKTPARRLPFHQYSTKRPHVAAPRGRAIDI